MIRKIKLMKQLFTTIGRGIFLLFALTAGAQPEQEKILKVGIYEYPPFVMIDGEDFHGFDIDYIETIGLEMGKSVRYSLYKSSNSALKALKNGEVELAIGGLSVTESREEALDFSHSYYQSGLSIMVNRDNIPFFKSLVHALRDRAIFSTFAPFLLFIILSGVVFWLCERKFMVNHKSGKSGIGQGMWLSYATATTIGYGDVAPRTPLGKLFTIPISLIGFIVIGSISGLVSSLMTMEQLSQYVLDVSDLKGKRVAYKGDTASEERIINHYAPTFKFEARRVESAQKAFDLLKSGNVDAFIHDAPLLLHHANGKGAGDLHVVGKMFENQIYAIAFRMDSDMQETIKRIQLKLQQRGLLDKLKPRYGI